VGCRRSRFRLGPATPAPSHPECRAH
jgi:hypothetical protein